MKRRLRRRVGLGMARPRHQPAQLESDAAGDRCSTSCTRYQTPPSRSAARRPRETPPPRPAVRQSSAPATIRSFKLQHRRRPIHKRLPAWTRPGPAVPRSPLPHNGYATHRPRSGLSPQSRPASCAGFHPLEQVGDHQNPLPHPPALPPRQPPQLRCPRVAAKKSKTHGPQPYAVHTAMNSTHIRASREARIRQSRTDCLSPITRRAL